MKNPSRDCSVLLVSSWFIHFPNDHVSTVLVASSFYRCRCLEGVSRARATKGSRRRTEGYDSIPIQLHSVIQRSTAAEHERYPSIRSMDE